MPRVIYFEIHADDPERAKKFYSDIFGWEIRKWDGPMEYWLIKTGPKEEPGIDGGMMRREKRADISEYVCAYVCTVDVPDIDEYMKKVKDGGGRIEGEKMQIPGTGWLAYCRDTEGNAFGIIQPDLM